MVQVHFVPEIWCQTLWKAFLFRGMSHNSSYVKEANFQNVNVKIQVRTYLNIDVNVLKHTRQHN